MANNTYPLVTIGIPTYNRADNYLKQTLKSAVSQTYPHIEIVVSDNCSPDNTEVVVKRFDDPRTRYFRQANGLTPEDNFNFCLEQAKGDYFLLLHDDDLIDEDFVEVCIKSADYATNLGLILTGVRRIDGQGNILQETPNLVGGLSVEDFFRGWFKYKTSWYFCSTLFNTKALREIGGLRSKRQLVQDGMAIVQLAAKFDRVDVSDVKASFRVHPFELTHAAKVSDWCDDYLVLLNLMCELASKDKAEIRAEGMRFFTKLNYNRARGVKSSFKRLIAYSIVFKKSNFRYLPSSVSRSIRRNPLSNSIRTVKRKIKPA